AVDHDGGARELLGLRIAGVEQAYLVEQNRCHVISRIARPSIAPTSPSTWRPSVTIWRPLDTTECTSQAEAANTTASTAAHAGTPAVRTVSSRTDTRSARAPGTSIPP